MKKLSVVAVFLCIFCLGGITYGISENQVDGFGKSIGKALIKKVEKGEMTFDKARGLVEYGIKYYSEDLKKQTTKKDSKNNLSAFCIMSSILKEYNQNVEDTIGEYCGLEVGQEKNNKEYTLVSVIDGDTIKVEDKNGKEITVRMIGIDSPENTTKRFGYVECYGDEAKEKLEQILGNNETVKIETDSTQGTYDMYNRLLGYVFINENINVNQLMIYYGYGWEYTYDKPYKYQSDFKEAQESAKKDNQGLWNSSACDGERKAIFPTSSSSNGNSISSSLCGNHTRYLGPKGGCYYYTNTGEKEYGDHSCCY